MAENVREGDSPATSEVGRASEAPDPTSRWDDGGPQEDEHAAMRQTVAREYADALGKRYEPPSGETAEPPSEETAAGEQPRFEKAEIGKGKISEFVMHAEQNWATGLTAKDADRIETQIRDGVKNGTPVPSKSDQDGQRWSVDVPVTGPAGTVTVRTAWIVERGSDRPRLATISLPPRGR